jgi:hypothetical protein
VFCGGFHVHTLLAFWVLHFGFEPAEKILVHPDSQDWFIDVVSSIVDKCQIKAPIEKGAYGNT